MAARKDNKGRALKKGEFQRSSDGRYAYAYTDPFGKRRSIYAKDLIILREKEKTLKKDQLDGMSTYVAGKADLNFVFDRYMSTKTELRRTTYTNYHYMYDRFVRNTIGNKIISEIKYSDILYFYYHLLSKCNLQINTLETIHTILHPTFTLAVRDNIIRTNPCSGVMGEIKKKSDKKKGVRHALTKDQQRAFIYYVRNSPIFEKWAPIFTFFLGTGCRVGEIIGLRWEDINFERRTIDINHSMTYYPSRDDDNMCEFKVSDLKTAAGMRVIPMFDKVYEVLLQEYQSQCEYGFNKVQVDNMTGFIFTNRFGNIHNPGGINRAIKRVYESFNAEEILNAAKEKREPVILPHFSCHNMRHTFCTRLCENENNLKIIQDIMGHADIETTLNIYAHVTQESKNESMIALSNKLDVF